MKVVIYTHYLASGGAEKRASVYANYLFKNGVEVVIVTMHKVENEYFVDPLIERKYISDSKQDYKKLSKRKRLLKLRKIFESIDPDVVVSFLPTYGLYASLAKRHSKILKNTKLVYSVSLYQRKYSPLKRVVDFLCCLFTDVISLQCNEQIKCNRLFKKKCIINYNPFEDKWNGVERKQISNLSLISAGRLTSQKNFPLIIKSVKKVHDINPNISLDIYGKGSHKLKIEKLILKLGCSNYVRLHEFSFNLATTFLDHNCYVSASRFEGFPNALAEAMFSGLTCVSTKCPTGPGEIIKNGENGFFFKDKKELVELLLKLQNDFSILERISKAARKTIQTNFEDKVVLPKFLEDISKL